MTKLSNLQSIKRQPGSTPPSISQPTGQDDGFHPIHINGRSDRKHGAFLLRIHLKRRLAPHQLSGNVHSRTGSSAGNFERGRGQFLCLSGLYPFTNKGIRFSGYFSILNHVLGNARRLLSEKNTPI